jgi:hypothetical protein
MKGFVELDIAPDAVVSAEPVFDNAAERVDRTSEAAVD